MTPGKKQAMIADLASITGALSPNDGRLSIRIEWSPAPNPHSTTIARQNSMLARSVFIGRSRLSISAALNGEEASNPAAEQATAITTELVREMHRSDLRILQRTDPIGCCMVLGACTDDDGSAHAACAVAFDWRR